MVTGWSASRDAVLFCYHERLPSVYPVWGAINCRQSLRTLRRAILEVTAGPSGSSEGEAVRFARQVPGFAVVDVPVSPGMSVGDKPQRSIYGINSSVNLRNSSSWPGWWFCT